MLTPELNTNSNTIELFPNQEKNTTISAQQISKLFEVSGLCEFASIYINEPSKAARSISETQKVQISMLNIENNRTYPKLFTSEVGAIQFLTEKAPSKLAEFKSSLNNLNNNDSQQFERILQIIINLKTEIVELKTEITNLRETISPTNTISFKMGSNARICLDTDLITMRETLNNIDSKSCQQNNNQLNIGKDIDCRKASNYLTALLAKQGVKVLCDNKHAGQRTFPIWALKKYFEEYRWA